jgi:hypothetical protein
MNIIELAKQAGFERLGHTDNDWVCYPEDIEAFAELVAAQEREECAKLFETITKDTAVPPVHFLLADTAKLIRARSNT